MSEWYKGFEIFVARTLASGQKLFAIRDLDIEFVESVGRIRQTTIDESKRIIDEWLGLFDPTTPSENPLSSMTQEAFDQLQAGTVALWEKAMLEDQIQKASETLTGISIQVMDIYKIKDSIGMSLDEAKATVADISPDVTALTQQLNDMTTKLNEEVQNLTDVEGVIQGVTDSIGEMRTGYEGAIDTLNKKIEDLQTPDIFGMFKNIPIVIGAVVAVVVGVKVLDVMA